MGKQKQKTLGMGVRGQDRLTESRQSLNVV